MELALSIHKFARAPKKVILAQFWDKKDCSASCSAMAFQDVPHKGQHRVLYHVKTTIQIRNGYHG